MQPIGFPTSRLHSSFVPSRTVVLDHFALNTTVRCQQRCVYCFEGDRTDNRHLETEEVRGLIRDAAVHVPMIIFMGAETTLRKDFVELVAFAKSLGLRVAVSTNGLRFADRGFLRKAAEAGLDTIELSFPYPDADVYHAVTRVSPAGFSRLLQALDNINALPSSGPHLSVITVVSRYNYRRLDEIMRVLASRLPDREFSAVLRRVGPSRNNGVNPAAVPLSELRAVLPPLLAGWKFRFPVAVRNFPLCAVPGFEHLDADLAYLRAGTVVRQNFFGQKNMAEMYSDESLFRGHGSSESCAKCSLQFFCFSRGLFGEMEKNPANQPLPSVRPAQEVLAANGTDPKDVDAVLEALRSRFERAVSVQAQGSWAPPSPKPAPEDRAMIPSNKANRPEAPASPRRIEIHLGTRCNNACVFCMSSINRDQKEDWARPERVREELRHFYEKGCRAAGFLGGEPSVYPHIVESIAYARGLGYERIALCTNGTRLSNADFCRALVAAGLTRVTLSIHSHRAEVEDGLITGVPGNFDRKTAAIKNLVALRRDGHLKDNISLNPVLCGPTLAAMEKYIAFFGGLGLDDIRFNYIWPYGAVRNERAWTPSFTEAMPEIVRIMLLNEKRLGRHLSFGGIPRCALTLAGVSGRLADYLAAKYLDEALFDPGNDVSMATNQGPDRFVWQDVKKNVLKTGGPRCALCRYHSRCEGVWKTYADLHGTEELSPL